MNSAFKAAPSSLLPLTESTPAKGRGPILHSCLTKGNRTQEPSRESARPTSNLGKSAISWVHRGWRGLPRTRVATKRCPDYLRQVRAFLLLSILAALVAAPNALASSSSWAAPEIKAVTQAH